MADELVDLDPEQGVEDHEVPADLLELFEVLEWEAALAEPRLGPAAREAAVQAVPTDERLVTRAEWGARAPRSTRALHNPGGVAFHYIGPRMGPFPHSSCATKVRGVQAFHMDDRGWSDGAYNMIACPHGYVFVLRGRDVRSAANGTDAGNTGYHAVCALQGEGDALTDDLKRALLDARDYLRAGGTGDAVRGHRDLKATGCPGNPIYAWLKAGLPRPGGPTPPPIPSPAPTPPPAPPEDEMTPKDRALLDELHAARASVDLGKLNAPIVGHAARPQGGGWWVAEDGGVFPYGDAPGYGSLADGPQENAPCAGIVAGPDGYWLFGQDGGVFPFGPDPGPLPEPIPALLGP